MKCPNCDTGTLHLIDGRWSCDGCDYSETRDSRGPCLCEEFNDGRSDVDCLVHAALQPNADFRLSKPGPLASTIATILAGITVVPDEVCPCCEQSSCVPHLSCERDLAADVPTDIHCGEPETARCLLAHPCRFHATLVYKANAL